MFSWTFSVPAACEYLEGVGGICIESARCSAWHRGCLSVSPWISKLPSYFAPAELLSPSSSMFPLFLDNPSKSSTCPVLVFPLTQQSFEYVLILSYLSGWASWLCGACGCSSGGSTDARSLPMERCQEDQLPVVLSTVLEVGCRGFRKGSDSLWCLHVEFSMGKAFSPAYT